MVKIYSTKRANNSDIPHLFFHTFTRLSIVVNYNAHGNFEIYEIANQMNNLTLVNPVYADMKVISKREVINYYNGNLNVIIKDGGLEPEMF